MRQETGKKESRKLRKDGLVPGVLYGGEKNLHFALPEKELKHLIYTPNIYLVKLEVDGKKYDAVVKEVQFHPVSDQIIHLDLAMIQPGNKVTMNLPIHLTGNSVGLLAGGKLRQRRRTLKVKGLIENMPNYLEIDMTDLEIGDSLKVGDLDYDNLEILDPMRAMVVGVVSSRLIAKGLREAVVEEEEEEVPAEEGAEAAAEEEAAPSEEEKPPAEE